MELEGGDASVTLPVSASSTQTWIMLTEVPHTATRKSSTAVPVPHFALSRPGIHLRDYTWSFVSLTLPGHTMGSNSVLMAYRSFLTLHLSLLMVGIACERRWTRSWRAQCVEA